MNVGKYPQIALRLFTALVFFAAVVTAAGCTPAVSPRISGKAYYVDCAKGNDANHGGSASQAWRTLDKVNATVFGPGDGIFLRRGTTCPGALHPQGSGEDGLPITLGAYGWGARPVVNGGQNQVAFELYDQQYWHIQDIEITGGTLIGLFITGSETTGPLNHFRLTNLVVHNVYGEAFSAKTTGLVVITSGGNDNTINDVVIDGVTAYDTNQWGGIIVDGPGYRANPSRLSVDVAIRNSIVHHVYGDGIVLWNVQNGLIENSVAYETGLQPPPVTIGTPGSIWTYFCRDCIVQNNESYLSHSPDVDGGSYDVDAGAENNLYQYNYGHDTDSYCLSVFGTGELPSVNTIIRYNVCANNGLDQSQASSAGAVFFWTGDGGALDGVQVYNNTIYWAPGTTASALYNESNLAGDRPNFFKNNILFSTSPWMIFTNSRLELDYNLYWYSGDKDTIWYYGGETYKSFSEYQSGSGQDAHSLFADPLFREPGYHAAGRPETACTVLNGSPVIDAGTDVGSMGSRDFFGNAIPQNGAYDIGANEYTGVVVTPTRTNTPVGPTPTRTSTPSTSNLVTNPGFESGVGQSPTGWGEWSSAGHVNDSYSESGGHSGSYRGTQWSSTAYDVYTYQTFTGLTNGYYTLKAWVKGSGGQSIARMEAKNYGGSLVSANIGALSNWTQITISNINITNGQCAIGFYSVAGANQWINYDDVEFYKQ